MDIYSGRHGLFPLTGMYKCTGVVPGRDGGRGVGGGNSSVGSVLGWLSCMMQAYGFDLPVSFW